ncbi:MAG: hypothetical protein GX423_03920 [Nitrospiraceae bacterium]|nr:hypothetical protein [Nitrospiraceae bacterium]
MSKFPDIRTLMFVFSFISLIFFLSFVFVLIKRKTYSGFATWTASLCASFFGILLISLRGIVPDAISAFGGSSLVVVLVAGLAYGMQQFIGQKPNNFGYVAVFLAAAGALCYFTIFVPSVNARIVVTGAAMACFSLFNAFLVFRGIPRLLGGHNLVLVAGFLAYALLNMIRAILAAVVDPKLHDFMNATLTHSMILILMSGFHTAIAVGLLILNFQRVEKELRDSMAELKILRGIIPICANCKKVRDDKGSWAQIESYIRDHSEADFSHGICPECVSKLYPGYKGCDASCTTGETSANNGQIS